jgi:hypothetical protein
VLGELSKLDFNQIGNRLWRFFHDSGHLLSEFFEFLPDGKIGGYQHRNECFWRIENGVLCVFDVDMTMTVRFDEVGIENHRHILKGRHLPDPTVILCLLELGPSAVHNEIAADRIEKRVVRSFDIFDTLICRTLVDPTDVFDIVERAGVENFKNLRLHSQGLSNHTWADIYAIYQRLTGIDDAEVARIQKLELEAEMAVSYLVKDIYHRVRDGDILVSDMYLPREALTALLKSVGFKKQVDIFVSSAGKASGRIWPMLKNKFEIEHHLGDNFGSDVLSPAQHGIASSHYRGTQAAPIEVLLAERGAVTTAGIVKRCRLTNPFPPDTRDWRLHEAQMSANLPFLLLMAIHLHDIMEREGLQRILFTTRDSCLLQPLFELLFPDADSHTFQSSRIALTERRPSYVEYVKHCYVPGITLIFDLHGAFKSGRDLFQQLFGILPRVHIFSGASGRAPDYPGLSFDVPRGTNEVEVFNLDQVGSLVTIDDHGRPIRTPMPATFGHTGALYRVIASRFSESLRPHLDIVRRELAALGRDIPWDTISAHIHETVRRTPEAPTDFSDHQSLTQIMNEVRSDKGSTYACAHCYTYVYERLIQEFAPDERLSILEIGLNRDGEDEIPSMRGWQKYFGGKATLYGADISPRFLRHHDPAGGIHILVADQSNARNLICCGVANPSGYDIIIDDSSHMSSHQQITLRTLWQFLRPGGFYIIEDLHYQPMAEAILSTRELLRSWRDGLAATTPHVHRTDAARIIREAAAIELHDSRSRLWGDKTRDALAVIRKQA